MAGAVSPRPWRGAAPLALALALACAGARAQELSDPTRPPAQLGAAPGEAAAETGAPQLQSVLLSRNPGGRAVAVISGQTARLGDRVGDAVLWRISAGEVVLKRGKRLETLRLFPAKTDGAAAVTRP